MRLAVCFDNLGPYHTARLENLASRCDLFALQFRRASIEYQWAPQSSASFRLSTIIENNEDFSPSLAYRRIDSVLTKSNPDVIAIPGWASSFAHILMLWSLKHHVPMILMSDSQIIDFPRTKMKEWLKSHLISLFSSAFVAGTKHLDYLLTLGFEETHITDGYDVVDNTYFIKNANNVRSIDSEFRRNLGLPAKYILCCARLVEKKNLAHLVDSYSRYLANRSGSLAELRHLLIVGDGPLKEDLLIKVASCGQL